MEITWIDTVGSTNAYLREQPERVGPMTMVCAREQTEGRGQRGNSWESEPGKNLTFSFYISNPGVKASAQFSISEAVALGIAGALSEFDVQTKVKWPNDIYAGERKICGILIENSILGEAISKSVVGIGINVNQTEFRSDAPNPVSMAMILGKMLDLGEVAETVGRNLEKSLARGMDDTHGIYKESLWRGDGRPYPFREAATGKEIKAAIRDVEPGGHLILDCGRYAFKEIIFL